MQVVDALLAAPVVVAKGRGMLADEIMPFIDRTYRTKRGPKYTAVAGSSFGGILSLHLAMTRSDKFSKAAVVSPSVWWDNRVMVKRVNDLKSKPPVKIWLDMGASEGPGALNDARALRDAMVAKGWLAEGDGPDLVVMCAPG